MGPIDDAMRHVTPLLRPGERLAWADRPRHGLLHRLGLPPRTPGALLAVAVALSAAAFGIGLALTLAPQGARAAMVLALALGAVMLGAVLAWRRPARALYGATDQGRGVVAMAGETLVFALPPRVAVAATRDLEVGDLDLGEVEVERHEGDGPPRTERRAVCLRAVAYPQIAADLLEGLARGAANPPVR
ncbi:MAG: hypothetical protein M9894_38935 [Planctomycetes bacterium]|nr:hypothetical protein [Planctomycetota bacterium]